MSEVEKLAKLLKFYSLGACPEGRPNEVCALTTRNITCSQCWAQHILEAGYLPPGSFEPVPQPTKEKVIVCPKDCPAGDPICGCVHDPEPECDRAEYQGDYPLCPYYGDSIEQEVRAEFVPVQLEPLGDEECWVAAFGKELGSELAYQAEECGSPPIMQYYTSITGRMISQATIEDILKKNGQLYRRKE